MMKETITPEEVELIKSAQAGSEPAFSRLFHKYKDFVEMLLYTYIKDMDEARDIANIVFLRVHEKLSTFTDYQSFGGWLRILSKNVAIDYLRTIKDHTSLDRVPGLLDYDVHDTEREYTDHFYNENVADLINRLPPTYRGPVELFYIEDMTIDDISEKLQMSKGTIKSALCRSRKILLSHILPKPKDDKNDQSGTTSTGKRRYTRRSKVQQKQ